MSVVLCVYPSREERTQDVNDPVNHLLRQPVHLDECAASPLTRMAGDDKIVEEGELQVSCFEKQQAPARGMNWKVI